MKECVTHHHACDCWEAKFAELEAVAEAFRAQSRSQLATILNLEAELERLREALVEAADGFDAAAEGHGVDFYQYALDIRALLEKGEKE